MIFPLRVFGSASAKRTSSGLAIAPMCLPTWPRSSSFRLGVGVDAALERDEDDHALALEFVRPTDGGGFRDLGVTNERALDLRGAETMAGDVEHVVDPAHDPEITVLVPARAVAGEIAAFDLRSSTVFCSAPCRRRCCAASRATVA